MACNKHPKMIYNKFHGLFQALKRKHYKEPKVNFESNPDRTWSCYLMRSWPTSIQYTGHGVSKRKAEQAAYQKLIHGLQSLGYFDEKWEPRFHSSWELKNFFKSNRVRVNLIPISTELRSEIDEIITSAKDLDSKVGALIDQPVPTSDPTESTSVANETSETRENENEEEEEAETRVLSGTSSDNISQNTEIIDMITKKPLEPLDERRAMQRNHDLFTRLRMIQRRRAGSELVLPISVVRDQITGLLNDNRVVIVAGGTGCGKTTQVPQFIFDDYIQKSRGINCNILVTQPRRISAVSVAQRVAKERFEKLGDSVGYHVRLDFKPPVGNGSILFMTPAMLLKNLWGNPTLRGISHVIVDEVHERDLWTEFMLIILKQAMKSNDTLKLILMSASVDTRKFSEYFDSCPVLSVEGQNYNVQEHFREDGSNLIGAKLPKPKIDPDSAQVDPELVADMLYYVHSQRPEGAILCFLPGWSDIVKVRQAFGERYGDRTPNYVLLPCHSRLSLAEQERIFTRPPPGVRKIVLATNIAETSITIDDVRYVVNSGITKALSAKENVKVLRQEWASQSSQIQRKGRAGRVSDGECFHLFTKAQLDKMNQYSVPAMLKEPLESVILFAKLCCPNEDPAVLLTQAMEAPSSSQMDSAISLLTTLNLLDNERRLTKLGAYVAQLGCHPTLGVAMIYAYVSRCIEPVLTLVSILQTDGLVKTISERELSVSKERLLEVRERFGSNVSSDHLAMVNLFKEYEKAEAEERAEEFIEEYSLQKDNLGLVNALRKLFAWELSSLGLCDNPDECLDQESWMNENSGNMELVKGALTAGLRDQLVWLKTGIVDRQRIFRDRQTLADEKNIHYITHNNSLFNQHALTKRDWANQLFFYTNRMRIGDSKMFRVDSLSAVNPIVAYLYGTKQIESSSITILNLLGDRFQLSMSNMDVRRFRELKNTIGNIVQWKLHASGLKKQTDADGLVEECDNISKRVIRTVIELVKEISPSGYSKSETETEMVQTEEVDSERSEKPG